MGDGAVVALEESLIHESESTFPRSVFLCPLYTRPIFPNVTIRSSSIFSPSSSFTSTTNINTQNPPALDKIKQAIGRMKQSSTIKEENNPFSSGNEEFTSNENLEESDSKESKSTGDAKANEENHSSQGASVIIERGYVDALVRLKKNGENYVAFSLVKQKGGLSAIEDPNNEAIYPVGVLAKIESVSEIRRKDGTRVSSIELKGTHRIAIVGKVEVEYFGNIKLRRVSIRELKELKYNSSSQMCKALTMTIERRVLQLSKLNHPLIQNETITQLQNYMKNASQLADFVANLISASPELLQKILNELDVMERLKLVILLLQTETELTLSIFERKNSKLGEGNNSSAPRVLNRKPGIGSMTGGAERNQKLKEKFQQKMEGLIIPKHAQEVIDEEMSKLSSLDPVLNANEHAVCRNHLTWLLDVPWGLQSPDQLDLNDAKKILNEDHYGLEDVKERILEFIAVALLKGSLNGKIICFIGPPGVGKTSIGKSISRAIGRKFYRFSVGGMNDVAEIKGHRRTYIGAMPGKIVQSFKQTRTMNPVLLIDEIDKMSKNWNGDPASALLEVLDPEQNANFLDHYLNVTIDLSKVLFICTANSKDTIPRPLLDRMEIINISGYFAEEKIQIAKNHLIPNLRKDCNLNEEALKITDDCLMRVITSYCRDAGVRSLNKQLEKIFRKAALKIAMKQTMSVTVDLENLESYVGKPVFLSDRMYEETGTPPGIVAGLAYNSMGGSLIWIESVIISQEIRKDKSEKNSDRMKLKTTGKLGDVMKESTEIAYTFSKKFCHELESSNNFFEENSIHTHFPEGAIPKDGPSAGCAIVTSFLSLMLNKSVPTDVAMTGEITLTGKVLPVGGIKEKMMAAKRSGIRKVFLPEPNRRDFKELPEGLKEGMIVEYVDRYQTIFEGVFGPTSKL